MNFFEQELRSLTASKSDKTKPDNLTFIGRACYFKLSGNRRARMEFSTWGTADHYEALAITILDTGLGKIDSINLLFRDFFAAVPNNCGTESVPHIWNYSNKPEWTPKPTREDIIALIRAFTDYIALFA